VDGFFSAFTLFTDRESPLWLSLLSDGWTALMWATNNGHDEVVRILLSAGASMDARTRAGRTARQFLSHLGASNPRLLEAISRSGSADAAELAGPAAAATAAFRSRQHSHDLQDADPATSQSVHESGSIEAIDPDADAEYGAEDYVDEEEIEWDSDEEGRLRTTYKSKVSLVLPLTIAFSPFSLSTNFFFFFSSFFSIPRLCGINACRIKCLSLTGKTLSTSWTL
jgi:hypothetical protein